MADEEGEQLLTVDQVARRLQLHPATIRRRPSDYFRRQCAVGRRSEVEQIIGGVRQPELPGVGEEPKKLAA